MSDNAKVWTDCNIDEEDIKLIVKDVLAFRPVIIVGRVKTGKSEFTKALQMKLGEVLYIDEHTKGIYDRYLGNALDSSLDLFTEICDKECLVTIIDGVNYVDNFDNIKGLFVNHATGVICTTLDISSIAKFGLDISEFTIIKLDRVGKDFVYEIERG